MSSFQTGAAGSCSGVIGCHEDEYFVGPIFIKIDNCAELSSGDDGRNKFIAGCPSTTSASVAGRICHDLFSGSLNGVISLDIN